MSLDLTEAIEVAVKVCVHGDVVIEAAAPLIEAAVREKVAQEIKEFAKEAAETDSPDAIIGLIAACHIASGQKAESFDALADELDDALARGQATPIGGMRYGQPACDCGHVWGIHDVQEYPGDHSEMCCVWRCDQQGCPGRTQAPEPMWQPQTPDIRPAVS